MEYRRIHARIDDHVRRSKVERVRQWVYEKGRSLRSKHIDAYLGPEALVPTQVSRAIGPHHIFCSHFPLEFLLETTSSIRFRLPLFIRPGSTARIRVRCVESNFHAPGAHLVCVWGRRNLEVE